MAYDIEFSGAPDMGGKSDRFFLCSTGQWQMFADWASALTGEYPCLKEFAEKGECENTFQIKTELTQALNDSHPESDVVSSFADYLLDKIGEGDAEEMVAIKDGSED